MLRKNALARSGKCLLAKVANLIAVCIGMSGSSIGTNLCIAKSTVGCAVMFKGVADAIKRRAAVSASRRARIDTNVAGIGIFSIAECAGRITLVGVIMLKAGGRAANRANRAILFGSNVLCRLNVSYFAAIVAVSVAIACIGVSNAGALDVNAAVLANGTAISLGGVCNSITLVFANNSVTGGASLDVAGGVASLGVGVGADCLAAAVNETDTVAIKGGVIVADVVANGFANVANRIVVFIDMRLRAGSAALGAGLRIAIAFPFVLLLSFVSATVVTDLIASIGVLVLGVCFLEAANVAGAAATVFVAVLAVGNKSRAAAVNASNRAFLFIGMRSLAGSAAGITGGGAGMQPSMNEIGIASQLAACVTGSVASVRVGVDNAGSGLAADAAGRRASSLIGVNQCGACCFTNVADGIALAIVSMSDSVDFRVALCANRAIAGCAGVFNRGLSLNRYGTAVADRVAIGRVGVVDGAEAGCERKKRQSHSQKQEENSFHFSLQKIVF